MRSRLFFLHLGFLVFTAALIVRLFSLQVLGHEYYKNLAENQHQVYKTLVPTRGEIFAADRKSGKPVAVVTNIEKDLVYAVPPEITDKQGTAHLLSPILQMREREVLERIADNERKWVSLKRGLPESASESVKNLNLGGIYLQAETYRSYPEKSFAAQVLGFFGYQGDERVGRYGIEEQFQDLLAGKAGSLKAEKDVAGRWISGAPRQLQPAEDGANILLTIDRAIQFKAETVLKNAVEKHQADSGAIVILDPKTGVVLAIASFPNFDPNIFNEVEDVGVFRNQAISEAYEPGSVFKTITMAAALDAEAVTADTIYEDTGSVGIDRFVIRNAENKVYGQRTMTQVLEESINTGAIFAQKKTGRQKFLDTVQKFGFGKLTGLTLPAESPGDIRNLLSGGEVHFATASFGQGVTVTPMQIASALGAIGNSGRLVKPYIVEEIQYPDGRIEKIRNPETTQVISSKAANTLSAMLVSVVENGHGKRAGVPGHYVAGKTGTAQVAKVGEEGYDPDKTVGTFAGFAPVDNPAFAMAVKIVNPKDVRFAESTAAPAFGEMARYLLNYYQIPPHR